MEDESRRGRSSSSESSGSTPTGGGCPAIVSELVEVFGLTWISHVNRLWLSLKDSPHAWLNPVIWLQVVTQLTPLAPPTKGLMKGVAGANCSAGEGVSQNVPGLGLGQVVIHGPDWVRTSSASHGCG